MKQRLLLILSLLLMVAMSQAAPVDANKAKDKALQFLSGKQAKARGMEQGTTPDVQLVTSEGDSYYVFNVGQQNGFVIVSGDDRAPEILGYSDSGTFDTQDIPENMRAWLQGYAEQIQLLDQVESPAAARAAISLRETPWTAIAPLIQTKWDQKKPYNAKLPKFVDGSDCVTGCVATAMAQVLYYVASKSNFTFPLATTKAIDSYDCKTNWSGHGKIHVSTVPITNFNWGNMKLVYTESETNDAVADLMLCCGASVKMDYRNSANGGSQASSSNVPEAFQTYFGFDQSVRHIKRSYYGIDEWESIIYEELKNGRPVLYGGQTSRNSGHEFICDGYDGNGLFHFNWGWAGNHNGYFVLWTANPNGTGTGASSGYDGYSMKQDAVIGIQKPSGEQIEEEKKLTVQELFVSNNVLTYNRNSVNDNFTGVKLCAVIENGTSSEFRPSLGFALYDGDNRISLLWNIDYASLPPGYYIGKTEVQNGYKYTSYSLYDFGAGRTGTYTIVPVSKETTSSTWIKDGMSDHYYIEATMTETELTLRVMPTTNLEVTKVEYTGNKMANLVQEVKVTVKNNGTEYNDKIYLRVNDKYVSGEGVALREGEATDVYFHYVPSSGTNNYNICLSSDGSNSLKTGSQVIEAFSATDNIDLDMKLTINSKSKDKYLFGNTLSVTVSATNKSDKVYNGYVGFFHDLNINYQPVTIQQGQTYNVDFSMSIDLNQKYELSTLYMKNGDWVYTKVAYTAAEGVEITNADGTTEMALTESTMTVPEGATSFDLRGVTSVTTVNMPENPSNCLILTDENSSLTGKNIIKGTTAANIELTDGADFAAPIDFTSTAISYERTFTQGTDGTGSGWTTIILPFDVQKVMVGNKEIDWFHSKDDINKNFWIRELVSDGDGSVTFGYVDELKANTPYIIAVPGDKWGSQWSLVGKTLKFIGKNANIIKDATAEEEGDHYRFTGTTTKQQLESVYTLNAAGSSFTLGNATVDPFRAYFSAISSNSRAIDLQILSAGNQATAITLPDVEPLHTGEIYSIDGRMMGTSIESLPKGIYVVDGKKVVK